MSPKALTALLVLLTIAVTAAMYLAPQWVPLGIFTPIVLLAGFSLPLRGLVVVATTCVVCHGAMAVVLRDVKAYPIGTMAVLLLVVLVMVRYSSARTRQGVEVAGGDAMIVDLRDRLEANGNLPDLPDNWRADKKVNSAHGDAFSGDFVITALSADGRTFEVALVDVSGKGAGAATRALLLSGALSGLLGAMDADGFLPAANAYLLRQRWEEGFATAIHACIDLATGAYSLGNAGHPPGAQFEAGSGRWRVIGEPRGPLLGVLDGVEYHRHHGQLTTGDALILVTDGIIETPGRDITDGIDRLLGTAETLVSRGFEGGAARLCDVARAGDTDDRAAVLIWRR